jgi:hypothetical protein
MESHTYNVGASYRRDIMIRLDELGLPYTEHRTMLSSTLVVKTYTTAQEDAYDQFAFEVAAFQKRLNQVKRQRAEKKKEALRKEIAEKLARKNRFRKLTFRKPLKSL